MITAAQQNKSANKNKYKILYPLDAKIKTNTLKSKIIKFVLLLISLPLKYLLILFPSTIIKLEIALINVSIVLKVKDIAKINTPIIIREFLLSRIKSKKAKSGITFELSE